MFVSARVRKINVRLEVTCRLSLIIPIKYTVHLIYYVRYRSEITMYLSSFYVKSVRLQFFTNKCRYTQTDRHELVPFQRLQKDDRLIMFTRRNPRNINPLNPELHPICYLLALLAHNFLHVSRIRVKSLTLRLLMSYIGVPILDVSRSHTTTQHSR